MLILMDVLPSLTPLLNNHISKIKKSTIHNPLFKKLKINISRTTVEYVFIPPKRIILSE